MSLPPFVIRCSALPGYPDCQRRTASRLMARQISDWGYVLGEQPKSIGSMVGTATHAAAGWMLQEKIRTGVVGNSGEAEDRGIENFKEQRDGAEINYDTTTPSSDTAMRQIMRMTRRYAADVAPASNPTAVEEELELTTRKGNILRGHLDLTESGPRDLKTGTKRRVSIAQYGSYSLLLRANGRESSQIIEDFLPRVKLKEIQPPVHTVRFDLEQAEGVAANIITRIEHDYERFMETGDPGKFLANPNSVLCSKRYCACFGTDFCPESRAKAKEE